MRKEQGDRRTFRHAYKHLCLDCGGDAKAIFTTRVHGNVYGFQGSSSRKEDYMHFMPHV